MSTNKYWNIHMQKLNIKELLKALYVHTNKFGIYTKFIYRTKCDKTR